MSEIAVEFRWVEKRFGGVHALQGVSLSIVRGEAHAFCGENGAGKSTLAKLVAGVHRPDAGELVIEGEVVDLASPRDALRRGIAMVHQELALCPDLSVAENLYLGRLPSRAGWVRAADVVAGARSALDRLGLDLDPTAPIGELSVAERQLVSIAAAIDRGARVLVFDEATSSLSEVEAARLRTHVRALRERGATVIWVSHRTEEVLEVCDRMSVLRDGRLVASFDRGEVDADALVSAMIGRRLEPPTHARTAREARSVVLAVDRLSSPRGVETVSFEVGEGEILGVAGLVGAGKTEIASALYGLDRRARGRVTLDGRELALGSTRRALDAGIALVPEDRKRQGLVLDRSVRENWSLGLLDRFARWGWIDERAERVAAERSLSHLATKFASLEDPVAKLSGGNQQKVIFSRTLERDLRLLLLDEPTRGVDVGAKQAIHELVRAVAASGRAVIVFSSDMPELLALAARILVLREGHVAADLPIADATEERILRAMGGVAS